MLALWWASKKCRMTEDHEGYKCNPQPPELEPEYREWERWLDGYIEHWGNAVGRFLEEKGHRKVKPQPRE
jgi:hypothetical protein